MPTSAQLKSILKNREPALIEPSGYARYAAVAIVVTEGGDGLHILYLLRSKKDGDPWSGHIAFPGGGIEVFDKSPQAAAERETREEIGLSLMNGEFAGRLDDLTTQLHPVHVSGFVYIVQRDFVPDFNHEIQEAHWISCDKLIDKKLQIKAEVNGPWGKRKVPAITLLGEGYPVLWGLTYRFTAQILGCLGHHIPGGSDLQITDDKSI